MLTFPMITSDISPSYPLPDWFWVSEKKSHVWVILKIELDRKTHRFSMVLLCDNFVTQYHITNAFGLHELEMNIPKIIQAKERYLLDHRWAIQPQYVSTKCYLKFKGWSHKTTLNKALVRNSIFSPSLPPLFCLKYVARIKFTWGFGILNIPHSLGCCTLFDNLAHNKC